MTKSASRSTQQKPKTDDSLHHSFFFLNDIALDKLLLFSSYCKIRIFGRKNQFVAHPIMKLFIFIGHFRGTQKSGAELNKKMQLLEEEKLCISQISIVSQINGLVLNSKGHVSRIFIDLSRVTTRSILIYELYL